MSMSMALSLVPPSNQPACRDSRLLQDRHPHSPCLLGSQKAVKILSQTTFLDGDTTVMVLTVAVAFLIVLFYPLNPESVPLAGDSIPSSLPEVPLLNCQLLESLLRLPLPTTDDHSQYIEQNVRKPRMVNSLSDQAHINMAMELFCKMEKTAIGGSKEEVKEGKRASANSMPPK